MNQLAKRLYSGAQRPKLRHEVRVFYFALACGIVTALLVAGFLYWIYSSGRFLL